MKTNTAGNDKQESDEETANAESTYKKHFVRSPKLQPIGVTGVKWIPICRHFVTHILRSSHPRNSRPAPFILLWKSTEKIAPEIPQKPTNLLCLALLDTVLQPCRHQPWEGGDHHLAAGLQGRKQF